MNNLILDALEQTAARLPEKIAFADEQTEVSFSALVRRAQSVAAALIPLVPPRSVVGFYMDKGVETVVGFMGAVYAGCAYAQLNLRHPAPRVRAMLETLDTPIVVTDRAHLAQLEGIEPPARILLIEELEETPPDAPALAAVRAQMIDADPLYVNFTSGSTGTPKGIVIPHRAILDFTAWMTEFCGYTEDEVFGNQAPFYFDLSGKDVYQTLSLGASCRIFEKKYFTFPMLLLKAMEEAGVTAINWATSAFHLVAASGALTKYAPTHLKKAALGGEALQARYVNLWKASVPGLQVVNMYGPTETTIDCAAMHLTREYRDDEPIPIGRACRNKQIILLKDDLTEAQPGEPGEICVRGSGVAAGYFADPAKTDAAFIQNPLCPDFRDILYRTGDMAVLREDGYLYFLARRDGQIKHMGYRIELGEIEVALHSLAGMQAAACLYDAARDRILCVYAGGMEPDALAKDLRKLLPKYMLPNLYEKLEALPYNANGKIDRVALKERYLHAEG